MEGNTRVVPDQKVEHPPDDIVKIYAHMYGIRR